MSLSLLVKKVRDTLILWLDDALWIKDVYAVKGRDALSLKMLVLAEVEVDVVEDWGRSLEVLEID
jgi:hypothetical protein